MTRFFEDQKHTLRLIDKGTSQCLCLCYESLLNLTNVAYKKAFFTKCNSGRIAIQWFQNRHYLGSIGTASANSAKFRGIRPRMHIEDLL